MSGIVEQHESQREERSLRDFLKQLIEGEDVTGAAAGITKKVIAEGEASLVGGQGAVFDAQVRKPYLSPRCSQCGGPIPYDEAYEALHGDGLCSSCAHSKEKFFRD